MKRDFSEAAKKELLSLVKEVNDEQWFAGTDWVGDRWLDFEGWIGRLDVGKYVDNVRSYHKKVIDKNNTTAEQIETIFKNVNDVSTQYKSCFAAQLSDLQEYKKLIDLVAATISSGGQFNPEFVGKGLKNAVNTYLNASEVFQNIAKDGLTQEEIDQINNSNIHVMQIVLARYAAVIVDNMPGVALGQELDIPIGPDVSVFYKVTGEPGTSSKIEIEEVLQEQKVEIKKISHEIAGGISGSLDEEGNVGVSVESPDGSEIEIGNGTTDLNVTVIKDGDHTIQYGAEINLIEQKIEFRESVTTELPGDGKVTTTIGLRKENNSDRYWQPVPVPVEVEVPYPAPDFNLNIHWDDVGKVVIVAGVTYVVIKTAAGLALMPFTGGASAALIFV